MERKKKLNTIFSSLNILSFAYVIHLLVFGENGPMVLDRVFRDPHVLIVPDPLFLFCIALLLILSLSFFLRTKRKIWLLQFLIVLASTAFWKSDLIQSTLLYKSPTSMFKPIQERVAFIEQNGRNIREVIKFIDDNVEKKLFELGDKESLIYSNRSIRKELFLRFNDSSYSEIKDGRKIFHPNRTRMTKVLSEFYFPENISKKIDGYNIESINIQDGAIVSCSIKSDERNTTEALYPFNPRYGFYPSGIDFEASSYYRMSNFKTNYYKERYCSYKGYYLDKFWSFSVGQINCGI